MKHSLIPFLLVLQSVFFISCGEKQKRVEYNMVRADVRYISQRIHTMVTPYDDGDGYDEGNILFVGDLQTVVQSRYVYEPSGKLLMLQRGAGMGPVTYAEGIDGRLPFIDGMDTFRIETDLFRNRIIDIHRDGCDTLRYFVILEDLQIIMSEDNYNQYQKSLKLADDKRTGERITFYRYK